MATPPAGWKQSDPNDPGIYTNNSLRLIDKDKFLRPISVVANDINGSYMVYEKTTFGNKLLYQIDKNSNKNLDKKRFEDITIVDKQIEKDVYKLVQNTGIKDNIEALNNSKVYKHLAQVQQPPKDGTTTGPNSPPDGSSSNPDGNSPDPASPNDPLEDLSSKFASEKYAYDKWLKYPESMNSGQDRITISQINYVAAKLGTDEVLAGSLQNRESQFAKQDLLGMVTLPMPNEISEANTTGWGEDSLSTIAAALMKGGTAAVGEFAEGQIFNSFGEIGDTLKRTLLNPAVGTRAKQFVTTKAAASLISKAGIQINPEAYITRATGSAINPNLELLFQGPKLRQFGFTFKMSPRSKDEARNIRYIIKFFKKGMSPKRSTDKELSLFLGTPNLFKIEYKSGENSDHLRSIGKIKTCALVNFSVNYTPDGFYAAYNDADAGGSQPVAVVMTLAFSELTPIFNGDYDDTDSVGPDHFNAIEYTKEP